MRERAPTGIHPWQRLLLTVVLLVVLSTAGCKDVNDINQRTLASGLGLDAGSSAGEVEVTLVFFSNEQPGGSNGGGGVGGFGGGEESSPSHRVAITGSGPSSNAALLNIAGQAPGQVFLGSATLLLIGSELAQEGTGLALDYFLRHPHFSAHVKTVIVAGRTSELLHAPALAAPSPGTHLFKALRAGTREDATLRALPFYRLFDLSYTPWAFDWTALVAPGPIGPVVIGGALLRGENMIRTISNDDLHFLAAINRTVSTHIIVPPLPNSTAPMALRFRSIRIKPKSFHLGQTSIGVTLEGQAYLAEGRELTFLGTEGDEVRRHIETYLAHELERILRDLYEDSLDALALGESVRAQDPSGKVPPDWLEQLPQFTFTVETDINFLGGLRRI